MSRILVIMPSWVGDAVMATPALRRLRDARPGSFIGALVRPGIDEVLAGSGLLDEVHVDHARGMMGHKHVASRLRQRRYDDALLMPNSFSSALIARLAGIPRRIGYARDARGMLLTHRLTPPRRPDGRWAPIPAVSYYWRLVDGLLEGDLAAAPPAYLPDGARLELGVTETESQAASDILTRAGVSAPFAILNPGGNNPAKRWPPDRFAALAGHLAQAHRLAILINGSPAEAEVVDAIAGAAPVPVVRLHALGNTIGTLKALLARRDGTRCRVMITNDTGPRHFAAAFGVPVVSLFGPTDPRWTTIPAPGGEEVLVADPTLPESDVADDFPDRCRIDRIALDAVVAAADRLLARS